jgi:hypothetical protein
MVRSAFHHDRGVSQDPPRSNTAMFDADRTHMVITSNNMVSFWAQMSNYTKSESTQNDPSPTNNGPFSIPPWPGSVPGPTT